HQGAELDEGARIQQHLDAVAGGRNALTCAFGGSRLSGRFLRDLELLAQVGKLVGGSTHRFIQFFSGNTAASSGALTPYPDRSLSGISRFVSSRPASSPGRGAGPGQRANQ